MCVCVCDGFFVRCFYTPLCFERIPHRDRRVWIHPGVNSVDMAKKQDKGAHRQSTRFRPEQADNLEDPFVPAV